MARKPTASTSVVLPYKPHPKQALLHSTTAKQIFFGGSAGGGKRLRVTEPIPTPSGWTTMGELTPGDTVFDERGTPCTVVGVSPIVDATEVYRLTFDDGTVLDADGDHEWLTFDYRELHALTTRTDEWRESRRAKRPSRATGRRGALVTSVLTVRNQTYPRPPGPAPTGTIRTTRQISETVKIRGRTNHAVPVSSALDLPDAALPVEPYLLGVWLGDGVSKGGLVGMSVHDIDDVLATIDNPVTARRVDYKNRRTPFVTVRFECLTTRLRALGILGGKRIPAEYLRASAAQRLALLQGLMDTDGHACESGSVEFSTVKEDLAKDVHELIVSLGWKVRVVKRRATLNGRDVGPNFRMKWSPDAPVFRLQRKLVRQKISNHRRVTRFRYITKCERVAETVPMRCIAVDSSSHLYLAGRSMVPTHNSVAIRWDAIAFCLENPGLDAFLFRRSLPELEQSHIRRIEQDLPREIGSYNHAEKRYNFVNGSALNFCYCLDESDVNRYQSAEMHWLGLDEASHFTEYQITYLRGRVRLGSYKPKVNIGRDQPLLPRIVFASNPGGPGHSFLKTTFIEKAAPMTIFYDEGMRNRGDPNDRGWPSIYIPARMTDNPDLDPNYAGQFEALPDELRRALTEGDWDAVVGQALHILSREKHQVRPFSPPRHWAKMMSIDWGSARPFSVGWFAVSPGALLKGNHQWPDVWIPEGAIVMYDEWYGWNGKSNQGARLDARTVAQEVLRRETARGDVMDYRVGDTEMWGSRDGPSPADNMFEATDGRFVMKRAKKDRKMNYAEILCRLAGSGYYTSDGKLGDRPMFYATSNCQHFWRTVPTLVLDELEPDKGPETKRQEDHVYDCVSYLLRSRPMVITERDRYEVENYDILSEIGGKSIDPYATA